MKRASRADIEKTQHNVTIMVAVVLAFLLIAVITFALFPGGRIITSSTLSAALERVRNAGYVVFAEGEYDDIVEILDDLAGPATSGGAVTATLRVSPNGNGADGETWATAYTTIQDALDVASTDIDDCTLILISPHTTYYDINTTGDPTWAANVILKGTHRTWAEIRNTHAGATSILKLTGKSEVENLTFNLGTGSNNGLILTHDGFRVNSILFVGENLTGASTALWIDGNEVCHGKIQDCGFDGHITHMTGLLLDNACHNGVIDSRFHACLTAIQIVHADSEKNLFRDIDIGDCALGLDIDAGNEQHFISTTFHHNTRNVDDEVGDHIWVKPGGEFDVYQIPNDLVGTTVNTGAANTYGADTELIAAGIIDNPFTVIGITLEPSTNNEYYQIKASADGGVTFPVSLLFYGRKGEGAKAPSGTEHIFNAGTRISCSVRDVGGGDSTQVWLDIQEIR